MNPNTPTPKLLITTLAIYQTEFWAAVGHELKRQGREVAFLSFDDRSTELLISQGFETYAVTQDDQADLADGLAVAANLAQYGIQDENYWFSHERITFAIRDSAELRRKLLTYLALANRACVALTKGGGSVVMVQELGGFISVIASYFAARRHGIDNWFIEPAFFRGRMFFLRNTFQALQLSEPETGEVSPEVIKYLEDTLATGSIVVPQKDRHQYTTAFRKVVNFRNARRLLEKLLDKHVRGKHQEFGYIGRHVAVHARMLLNSLRLRASYTALDELAPFVYYPLHVPGDMALTLRSPQYLDQLALIDYLVRSVPATHKVVIKEHPAMIGALDAGRLKALLARYDNLLLLPPSTNNYEVLRLATAVVSVNSKSGAEAALLGKPVLVLGDAFYAGSPLVKQVKAVTELPELLAATLAASSSEPDRNLTARYFQSVWRHSLAGELYVPEQGNVALFVQSLMTAVAQSPTGDFQCSRC
jgi:hypothetical protein